MVAAAKSGGRLKIEVYPAGQLARNETVMLEQYPPAQRRILTGLAAAARGVTRLVELSQPMVEAEVYDAPAGTALVLANFTYRPIEALTARVPLAKPVRGSPLVGAWRAAVHRGTGLPGASAAGHNSVAAFTILLE